MRTEPLDPDTLAEFEAYVTASFCDDDYIYMTDTVARLVAVARDHARLTAENVKLRDQRDAARSRARHAEVSAVKARAVARDHARLTAENEKLRAVGEEAVERLSDISATYTEAYVGDLTQTQAWNGIERALRGPPPEGEAVVPRLAAALSAEATDAD
jgi:hypothetical protein